MRQGQALLLGLLIALLAGCTSGATLHTTSWLDRLRAPQRLAGPDVVQMDVALLERPVEDPYLQNELWISADEQTLPLERKAILEDNGLRVGLIGGILPARFQALLTSEKACVNPRRIQMLAGNTKALEIGPMVPQLRCQLRLDGQALLIRLEQATCTLQVQPTLTRDGRTRLVITPLVRHGETKLAVLPAADRSGWNVDEHRATESYAALAWEVTLAPNEYVLVGARTDRPGTLGHEYFIRSDEALPVQRLLVIRTSRPAPAGATDLASEEEERSAPRTPSLAVQAAWAAPRPAKP